jgi:hypothetical protein
MSLFSDQIGNWPLIGSLNPLFLPISQKLKRALSRRKLALKQAIDVYNRAGVYDMKTTLSVLHSRGKKARGAYPRH